MVFDEEDTITIADVVYTAKATENSASGYFELVDTGSPASDIEATALFLG